MNYYYPPGAANDPNAPYNQEETDLQPLIDKYIDGTINHGLIYDELQYLIELLLKTDQRETITDILQNYDN